MPLKFDRSKSLDRISKLRFCVAYQICTFLIINLRQLCLRILLRVLITGRDQILNLHCLLNISSVHRAKQFFIIPSRAKSLVHLLILLPPHYLLLNLSKQFTFFLMHFVNLLGHLGESLLQGGDLRVLRRKYRVMLVTIISENVHKVSLHLLIL